MTFVQIIEYRTTKPALMQAVAEEWEKATEGKRTVRRSVLCHDRDNSERYFNLVFFDSYEAAMENSAMPETDALSAKLMSFADGDPISTIWTSSMIGNSPAGWRMGVRELRSQVQRWPRRWVRGLGRPTWSPAI